MADLDDFFAKKDKKKKTKKFVTANTEVLATKLEETARKEHQAEMKAVSAAMTTTDPNFTKDSNAEGVSLCWLMMAMLDQAQPYSWLIASTNYHPNLVLSWSTFFLNPS